MKHILTFLTALLVSILCSANDSLTVVYRIRLDQNIDKAAERLVVKGLERAKAARAEYVILDLDTYGGAPP